jgi:hypothetical protein
VATMLSRVCQVSRQWAHVARDAVREGYTQQDLSLYESNWLMRQVAPVVTSFTYTNQISIKVLQGLTNLTYLGALLCNKNGDYWSSLQYFSKLDTLKVHIRYNLVIPEIYAPMLSITKLVLKKEWGGPFSLVPLNRLTNLTTLRVYSDYQLLDGGSLSDLTSLTSLAMGGGGGPFTRETLPMIPQLRKLRLDYGHLYYKGLHCFTSLRVLQLYGTVPMPDALECVSSLTSLVCLIIINQNPSYEMCSLYELSHLTSLTILSLTQCDTLKPEHLLPLTRLRFLNHDHCSGLKDYNFNLPCCDLKKMKKMVKKLCV